MHDENNITKLESTRLFLTALQKELKTQDKDSQAEPRFWVIRDMKKVPTLEEYADDVQINIKDVDSSMSISSFIEDVLEDEITDINDEPLSEDIKDNIQHDLPEDMIERINSNDPMFKISLDYVKEVPYIVPNTFFITKSEAKQYIKYNKHNLTPKAHTYAMSALRSPVVSKLWNILKETNWSHF